MKNWFRRVVMCRLGKHRRSKRRAKKDAGQWRSVCEYCGINMYRDKFRTWHVDDRQPR